MRICFINDGFNLGGVEQVVTTLSNAMAEEYFDITLLDFSGVNSFFYKLDSRIKTPKDIRKRKFSRKVRTCLYKKYSSLLRKELNVINIYKEQFQDLIIHLSKNTYDILILSQGLLTALVPAIKRHIPDIKIIAWQHNDYDIYINDYYHLYISDYILGLEKSDLVVCLTKEESEKYRKHNENTIYIYNPLTITDPIISNLKGNRILFVGRLSIKQKGLDYLLDLTNKIQEDFEIHIAGDGKDKNHFTKLISKSDLNEKVRLVGPLNQEELKNFYSQGTLLISTSRWEGFGLVITEAMASGLPIIAFENKGPNEILDYGKYGILVEKYNLSKFASEIESILKNRRRLKELQQLSLERSSDFNIIQIKDKWKESIKKLAKGNIS